MKGVLAVVLVCLLCGMVGSLVVGNRMAFFTDAMAHCAFAGVALGFLSVVLAGRPDNGTIAWVVPLVMVAFGVAGRRRRSSTSASRPGWPTTRSSACSSPGASASARCSSRSLQRDEHVQPRERSCSATCCSSATSDLLYPARRWRCSSWPLFVWRYNQLVFASFNPSLARTRADDASRLNNYLFIVLLALIVNLSIKAVGALLINALLVVPAAAAANLVAEPPADVLADGRVLPRRRG